MDAEGRLPGGTCPLILLSSKCLRCGDRRLSFRNPKIGSLRLRETCAAALVLRSGLAHVPEGRRSSGNRSAWDTLSAAYLSFLVGFGRNAGGRTAEAHAARGHPNDHECVGDAATDEMTEAHSKVVGLALNGARTERKAS
jgi:hypothetical protein